MTRLKVSFKIPSNDLAKVKNDIRERAAGDVVDSFFTTFYDTCRSMESELNSYERYLMSRRSADPVLGDVDTAKWSVSFEIFKRLGYTHYGRYRIENKQQDKTYRYSNYQPDFRVGRKVNPKVFPIRQRRVWVMSGQVGNLAAVRYALSFSDINKSSVGSALFSHASVGSKHVQPVHKKKIVFYSHKYGRFVFLNDRFYSSGGHERYRVRIDNIIVRHVEDTKTKYERYASKRISLLTSSNKYDL